MTFYNLFEMQVIQNEHDIKYHHDVLSLGTANRVKHLALHFAKYSGRLLNEEELQKTLSDITICCLSLANALKIRLEMRHKHCERISKSKFINCYIRSISNIAKACESLDHLENFPSRDMLVKETNNLIDLIISFLNTEELDLIKITKERLSIVESNNIFSSNIPNTISLTLAHKKGNAK